MTNKDVLINSKTWIHWNRMFGTDNRMIVIKSWFVLLVLWVVVMSLLL